MCCIRARASADDFGYNDLIGRDDANFDEVCLRDELLDDGIDLPPPGVLAAESVEELEAALAQFTGIAEVSLAKMTMPTTPFAKPLRADRERAKYDDI